MKLELKTDILTEGKINYELLIHKDDGTSERMMRWLLDTQEQATIKALIKLGWTPPAMMNKSSKEG